MRLTRKILFISLILLVTYTTPVSAEVGDLLISTSYKSLEVGEPWTLEEGYVLTINQIDIEGSKLLLVLSKYQGEVDAAVLNKGEMYVYEVDIGNKKRAILYATIAEIDKVSNTIRLESVRQYSDGSAQSIASPLPTIANLKNETYSSDTTIVHGNWMFDLDTGKETINWKKNMDFWWEHVTDETRYLVPQNGAKLANMGVVDINSVDCSNAKYSESKIVGSINNNEMPAGTVICAITNVGNYAKFKIDEYGYNLKISWMLPSDAKPQNYSNTKVENVPKLIFPLTGDVLNDGRSGNEVWYFDWSDVEGASEYQLYVIGGKAEAPVTDTITTSSSYRRVSSGYVVSRNYYGWTWIVRAKINGQWNEWSETGNFEVGKVPTKPPTPVATPTPTSTSVAAPSQTPSVPYTPPPQQNKSKNPTMLFGSIAILIGFILLARKSSKKKQETPNTSHKPAKRSALEPNFSHTKNDNDSPLEKAKSAIKDAEIDLQDMINRMIFFPPNIQQMLQEAQKEFAAGHFTTAEDHAHKCSEEIGIIIKKVEQHKQEQALKQRELEQTRKDASEQIKSAKATLKQAEWLGATARHAEELNAKAQSAFDTNDYSSAISYAKQSSDVTKKLIGESKPSISIKLPPKMEYDTWKHQDITVTNEGPVHAVAITITFLTALEVRDIRVIERLEAGEQKILNINVKPTDKGEVPVDYSIEFKDLMDRAYKTNSTKTIQIGTDIEIARTGENSVYIKSTTADKIRSKSDSRINTLSAFGYKGATIQYKVKVENPTPEPISDIKVHLFVPDVFLLEKNEKSISMLESNENKTVTFEIRPTGECGDCNVSGRVNYYDYITRKRQEIDLETKSLSVVCPVLKIKNISISEWRNITNNLVKTEETTKEISMPAETLFGMVSRVIEDMNMFMLKPEIMATAQMFNGVVRFYGEGVKEFKYATQIEVVGGAKKSKLILKAWAEREDALTGFYHKILDELEKRVHVKEYIDDNIVQNYYHYGDKIGTQVKDSFVYKSNVGNGDNVNCPWCGKEKTEGDPFCSGCGAKFE